MPGKRLPLTEAGDTEESLDRGPRDRAPTRRCIATRQSLPATGLLRFVCGPEGEVVFDAKRRLPGRGAWLTPRRALVAEAARKNLFARAFKAPVAVPGDLPDRVGRALADSALGALGLERRAGRLAIGFAEVEALLRQGQAALLIHAADAAPDGVRKLAQAAHAGGEAPPVCRAFGAEQLGLAFGRPNVIHAALEKSPGSDAVAARCRAYEAYAAADDGPAAEGFAGRTV